jgi:hypothetical protein
MSHLFAQISHKPNDRAINHVGPILVNGNEATVEFRIGYGSDLSGGDIAKASFIRNQDGKWFLTKVSCEVCEGYIPGWSASPDWEVGVSPERAAQKRCEKKSGIEGKVVDGKGLPMVGLKIVANQVTHVEGYEKFETVTRADGMFSFKKLCPMSEYILAPSSENWSTENITVQSGPERKTMVLPSPITIRFTEREDVIIDSQTGLQWQAEPTGGKMTRRAAKHFCESLSFGGFNNWHLPTISELRSLIVGCAGAQTGGDCGVTDQCLNSRCKGYACRGCPGGGGPTRGCYWPSLFRGNCDSHDYAWYSSSSALAEGGGNGAWGVSFYAGGIGGIDDIVADVPYYARCVRFAR